MLSKLVYLQNAFSAHSQQHVSEVCIPQPPPSHRKSTTLKDSHPANPDPLTHSQGYGQAPCHAGVYLRQAALLSQHSLLRKASCARQAVPQTTVQIQANVTSKFYLNSRTASLPNITFTVYNATVSSILREHQYFRTLSQCVYFYFKTYPPNSKTTFKTAS